MCSTYVLVAPANDGDQAAAKGWYEEEREPCWTDYTPYVGHCGRDGQGFGGQTKVGRGNTGGVCDVARLCPAATRTRLQWQRELWRQPNWVCVMMGRDC